ncbi:MAG: 5'/3'-nucleotidase SurE [Rikenellaceae bacterium]
MTILITNDDGFDARGIEVLTLIAREFAQRVVVVAPNRGYSGMSHSINMDRPIFVDPQPLVVEGEVVEGVELFVCTGAPVDCVKVALDAILKDQRVDLLLSGINHGSNSNMSVIYSGTMGAATEGSLYGIPSIGFSLLNHSADACFDSAAVWVRRVLQKVLSLDPVELRGLCLNVNIPDLPLEQIKGLKFTRQTIGNWIEDFQPRYDPRGRLYYWMTGRFINHEPEDATDNDEWALRNGYVAAVPVQMDLTDHSRLDFLRTLE